MTTLDDSQRQRPFLGTARDYARYRVPYPRTLFDDLCRRAGVSGRGRLLDLGCGPGRVALPLSEFFREVWAVDVEPEMIAVAREEAERRGVTHVHWRVGRAEDFDAEPHSFELVTAGDGFHRFDRTAIVAKANHWLAPGGAVATLGGGSIWTARGAWCERVASIVRSWTGARLEALSEVERRAAYEEPWIRAGFRVETHQFTSAHVWTPDAVLGHLRSTSIASPVALGDRAPAFEAAIRECLGGVNAGELDSELRFVHTLATKSTGAPSA